MRADVAAAISGGCSTTACCSADVHPAAAHLDQVDEAATGLQKTLELSHHASTRGGMGTLETSIGLYCV